MLWTLLKASQSSTSNLYMWGGGTSGQLGDGSIISKSSPVQIGDISDWAQISAGNKYSLSLKTDVTLWACGLGTSGQLGDGSTTTKSLPVQIGALTNWSKVSAGTAFALAVKTNGTLWAWGSNSSGQLGLNLATSANRSSPVQVGTETNW